jgi:hypothetical protein
MGSYQLVAAVTTTGPPKGLARHKQVYFPHFILWMPRTNAHFRAILISQDGEEPSRRTRTEDADKNKTSKLLQKISRTQLVMEPYTSSSMSAIRPPTEYSQFGRRQVHCGSLSTSRLRIHLIGGSHRMTFEQTVQGIVGC